MRSSLGGICAALLLLTVGMGRAQTVPHFTSAAAARAWGAARERAGQYQAAGAAYLREADLYDRLGDPQAGEAERRRAHRLLTDLALAASAPVNTQTHLAKWEPPAGCYLGALDETAEGHLGNTDSLAHRLGRPLAVAFNYQTYGQPFPMVWARAQAERGRLIQIAWEPQRGLEAVQDDGYLNHWADEAARCGTGIFLRFAGEMNGDWTRWGRSPSAYRRAFRRVHAAMARNAPNVAMVWAPNAVPVAGVDAYYPGDDAVDWVGISLYLVRFYDDDPDRPAWQDHPDTFIDPFYARYAARKPLCLVECGITRRSRIEGDDVDRFAASRIGDLFDSLRVRYPRLKMVCWFDRNNLTGAAPIRRLNDYSLPPGSLALAGFSSAVADPYFLGTMRDQAPLAYTRITNRLPTRYTGPLVFSLSTYALDSTLVVSQNGHSTPLSRPFRYFVTPGRGPLTVRVRDSKGRIATSLTLAAP